MGIFKLGKSKTNDIVPSLIVPTTVLPTTNIGITPTLLPTPVTSNINPGAISWLQFPKSLKLDLYKPDQVGAEVKYHQTATFSDGSILINAIVPPMGPGGSYLQRFIKSTSDQIYYLTSVNGNESYFLT